MTAAKSPLASEIREMIQRVGLEGFNLPYDQWIKETLYQIATLIDALHEDDTFRARLRDAEKEAAELQEQLAQTRMALGRLVTAKPGDPLLDVVESVRDELAKAGML